MNITRTKVATLLVASVATFSVSGCLSQNDAGDSFSSAPGTPAQNRPPVISGNPQTAVTVGESYSFTPTASDPDGDPLTFSITNRPSWANFDTNTGTLSGTPTLGSIGVHGDIMISVSDGSSTASLDTFPVDVVQVSLGSVTLSWTPPTLNADGTSLNDLVAYKFYYGSEPGRYTSSVRIDSPGVASHVIENLVPDTYYFVATAVNSLGIESRYSNEAVKQVL